MQRRGSGVGERYAALKPPRGDQLEKRHASWLVTGRISARKSQHCANHVNRSAADGGERPSTSVGKNLILFLHQEWG
jgi:hypothetical protein